MKFSIFKIILSVLLFSFVPVIASFSQAPPTFSKAFDVSTIGPGSVSTLTFTIINPNASTGISALAFTDNLPAGVTIATPANSSSSCGTGTLSAPDGGSTITFSGGTLNSLSTCIITVDVTSSTPGAHVNTSGDLTSSAGNSGTASATLTVSTTLPGLTKSFSPSTINIGERSTLTITFDNSANTNSVPSLNLTDNLPPGMVIATPLVVSNTCTPFIPPVLTALPGSNVISYNSSGISLFPAVAANSTCAISVDVTSTIAGSNINVTNDLLVSFVAVGKASAALEVNTAPAISIQKSFLTNPVAPGGTTNLEFTIQNFDRNFSATGIAFSDNLNSMFTGITFSGLPLSVCGGTLSESSPGVLNFTGGTLSAESSCTISVPVNIPGTASSGTYTNTTGAITATIDGSPVTGNTASEDLFIAYVPTFSKTFLTNPIIAGATTTVEFTITNTSPTHTLTDITFIDNLTAFTGSFPTTVGPLPVAGSCGIGSSFSLISLGSDLQGFELTGGSIPAGLSCTFSFDITMPAGTPGGLYPNTTSYLSAIIDGAPVSANPASDVLEVIEMPRLTKSFTNDPVNAGGTVNLEFTIEHEDLLNGDPATAISFTDDLNSMFTGITTTGLPLSICGGTLSESPAGVLNFTGGTLTSGTSCTVTVPLTVPATALPGTYTNTTGPITATVSTLTGTGNPATDDLLIGGLDFTKEFIPDTALPGELITLRFTIDNTTTQSATLTFFSDNLNAALPGLVAEAPIPVAPCGGTLSVTGTLFLLGGTVPASGNCFFDVPVRVPASAANGSYSNVTSSLSATINSSPVIISPATDLLVVNNNLIALTKTFTNDPVVPGNTVNVEYTLTNLDPSNAISNIAFTDDFDGLLTGLAAVGLPSPECGGTVSGTGILSFSGGSLAAGASCTFNVTVQTPASAPFGSILSCPTSSLTGDIGGLAVVGDPATDDLEFQLLQFSKTFSGTIAADGSTTLTFTITNPDPTNSVSGIRFTDDLNAVIPGLVATNLPITACGTSVTGTSIINFNGGSLGPGQTCSFDVTVNVPSGVSCGSYLNTTSVISADGFNGPANSNAASANLIIAQPGCSGYPWDGNQTR